MQQNGILALFPRLKSKKRPVKQSGGDFWPVVTMDDGKKYQGPNKKEIKANG